MSVEDAAQIFLSTPSARRATAHLNGFHHVRDNFYPRPPRGGRPGAVPLLWSCLLFLSTPSARRATQAPAGGRKAPHRISIHALREEGDPLDQFLEFFCWISIHALREEGDQPRPIYPAPPGYFYPRPPRGGRLELLRGLLRFKLFLSTPSARRATAKTEKNISAFVSL